MLVSYCENYRRTKDQSLNLQTFKESRNRGWESIPGLHKKFKIRAQGLLFNYHRRLLTRALQ
jgi:hypothetical protein